MTGINGASSGRVQYGNAATVEVTLSTEDGDFHIIVGRAMSNPDDWTDEEMCIWNGRVAKVSWTQRTGGSVPTI